MDFSIETALDAVSSLFDLKKAFKKGYVFELRDIRRSLALQVHAMVVSPIRYTLSEPFQVALTPTEAGGIVSEESGVIVREAVLEGTFGASDKRATGFQGVQLGGAPASGHDHFIHLREMFRTYSGLKRDAETAPFIRMVFHSIRDDDHFVVVPRSFETPRDARTSRIHYTYRITLGILGFADNTLIAVPPDDGFDVFFTDALATVSRGFYNARAAFSEVNAAISDIKRKVANIQAVMLNVAGFLNAVGNMLRGAADLIRFPLRSAASIVESLDHATDELVTAGADLVASPSHAANAQSLRRLSAAMDQIASFPNLFGPNPIDDTGRVYSREAAMTADDIERNEAGATIGTRTRVALGGGSISGIDLSGYNGILRVRVGRTTTIESLSAEFAVPPELIVLINDLRFPYFAPGGGPGMLAPGDFILVPAREGPGFGGVNPSADYLTAADALYGIDLALDQAVLEQEGRFDIREDDTRDLQDAQTVRGEANVVQGLTVAIRTERGSTVYVPDVGIRQSAGTRGTVQHVLLASLNLREAVLSDPRVGGIQDSSVILDGDVLTQEITPVLAGKRRDVRLILPFGSASG